MMVAVHIEYNVHLNEANCSTALCTQQGTRIDTIQLDVQDAHHFNYEVQYCGESDNAERRPTKYTQLFVYIALT